MWTFAHVQVATALQHVHTNGMVHMDVKPDNVYTCSDSSYKLGDFGLATQAKALDVCIAEGDSRSALSEKLLECIAGLPGHCLDVVTSDRIEASDHRQL